MVRPGGNPMPLILVGSIMVLGAGVVLSKASTMEPSAVAGMLAFVLGLPLVIVLRLDAGQITWDGERATIRRGSRGRAEFARAGTGSVLLANLTDGVNHGHQQFWLDADGHQLQMLAEARWNRDQLLGLAAAARIPVYDAGELTTYDLYQRYPALAPTIAGLDPRTPVTREVLGQVVRSEVQGHTATRADRMKVAAIAAIALIWLAGKATGAIG